MASRGGLGKVRHLEVRHIWVQELIQEKKIKLIKVNGKTNPADVLTKPIGKIEASRVLEKIYMRLKDRLPSSFTF